MRAFIAIDLTQEVKNRLSRIQEHSETCAAAVKWVEPANIHLTLKFLGEITEGQKEGLIRIITEIAKGRNAFPLSLSDAGVFPDTKHPRILWIGVDKGNIEIKNIVKELAERAAEIGIPEETRDFNCHITIARIKSNSGNSGLKEKIEKIGRELNAMPLETEVKKITLFKSTLSSKGASYQPLYEASLAAA